MDRNQFTGLFLIMVIMGASFYFFKPSQAELKKNSIQLHADSLKKGLIPAESAKVTVAAKQNDTVKIANKVADSALLKTPFGASTIGSEKFITVENKDLLIKLSTLGGRISSVELKDFKTYDKKPLILFDGARNNFGLTFNTGSNVIHTDKYFFTPTANSLQVMGKDSSSITMRLNYSASQYVDYIYSLKGTGYMVNLTVKPTGLDQVITNSNTINLDWSANMRKQEKDMEQERHYSTVSYNFTDGDNDYLSTSKDDQKDVTEKKVMWASFKAHFFSSVIIAKNGFNKSVLAVNTDVNDTSDVKQMTASLVLAKNADGTFPMQFYFGPNRFSTLKAQGFGLEKQIDMGAWILKYINRWSVLPIFNVLTKFTSNYGLIILALTVALKLFLSPLTYKSYLSMAKMRVLKPEMDEIKGKVGDDNPTLLQQEYLKLYKKAGVNPLGGCLPLVIQMPIVFAFFRFFPSLFELRGQSFLWMHDLSTYDSIITFPHIPFIGDHLSLMCVLMTISTLIYTYFNNQISGATGQMKYIGYITPVIFLGALNSFPAGLNYYYFLANMLTFTQQYVIRLMVDDKKIHAQIQENKKKPVDPKKKTSGFQARLEEMMRQKQQQTLPPAAVSPKKK